MLYAKQKDWEKSTSKEPFKAYARQLGLDLVKYNNCMQTEKYLEEIQDDMAEARSYGVSGTPASFIGDAFMGGVLTKEQLKEVIKTQINKIDNE